MAERETKESAVFKPVSPRVSFPRMEEEVLDFWKETDILRRIDRAREDAPLFTLYEGPPTANGAPGIHHVLARVFKDVIPRYKTMKGYRPVRKGGWDTHGLPVELEIEKELGISTKGEIEEYGIEKFNALCRASVMRYVQEWETLTDRIGFLVDMDDPYVTFTNDYIESGWWILKQLWDNELLYQGYRVAPHCPRCVTTSELARSGAGIQRGHAGSIGVRVVSAGLAAKSTLRARRILRHFVCNDLSRKDRAGLRSWLGRQLHGLLRPTPRLAVDSRSQVLVVEIRSRKQGQSG